MMYKSFSTSDETLLKDYGESNEEVTQLDVSTLFSMFLPDYG